ncbi:MAG: hypothetical protein CM15mP75_1660 [Flammeovirgaceae bacterium]|nr:MAG: hypothetical protein CM15mP75_1660 [Flammeovirgaceae bacterium]
MMMNLRFKFNLYLKNSNEFLGIKHNKNVEDYDILLTKNESFSDEEYTSIL